MSYARPLLTACLLTVGAVVSPLGVGVALADPMANFDWTPKPVVAGTPVTFVSTSTPFDDQPTSALIAFEWNLHGSGTCQPSITTGTCIAMAPAAGDWQVTLKVTDAHDDSDEITKTVSVQAPPPSPVNQPPTAAFVGVPSSPYVGEEVTFVSYSEDRDGSITAQAWDMDGDGRFDDGAGALATHRFGSPGEKTITLRVTDDRGATSTVFGTVLVREQPAGHSAPAPLNSPRLRLLSPFPVVRLVGRVTQRGTRIQLLSVRAPRGARALVRCRGRGCPVKPASKIVRRAPTRLKAAERVMPAGVVLDVLVGRGDRIGKFTRFKFRRNRPPRRIDGCLFPGTNRIAKCPRT
jgi:PKD domain